MDDLWLEVYVDLYDVDADVDADVHVGEPRHSSCPATYGVVG